MKKILIVLICAAIVVSLAACDARDTSASGGGDLQSSVEPSAWSAGPAEENEVRESGAQTPGTPGKIDMKGKLEFSGRTVDGEPVDSSIFSGYKLTMINVWGTLCKPCIGEMPDIEALYQEIKGEQVNIIGFVANILGGEDASEITEAQRSADAKKILDAQGVTFTNIVFDDADTEQIFGQVAGPKNKDGYRAEIENRLKETGR